MLKALKYLKRYWLSVLAVVVLVFVQVQCELALPDYMSDIVTYGIQYNGVTETKQDVLSVETYEHMQLFMSDSDKEKMNDAYTTADSFTVGNQTISGTSVYTLKDGADVSEITEKPFLIVSMLSSTEDADTVFASIEQMPVMAEQISSQVEKQMEGYTEDNLKSAQVMMMKNEYASLGVDMEQLQSSYIWKEGAIMLGIALVASIAAAVSAYLASRAASGAGKDMRNDVFAKVESFSSEEFSHFSTASLITRTTNDIQQVQNVLTMMLRIVLFAPMMGFTSLFKVLRYKELAGILAWAVLLMIVLMMIVFIVALPKFKISQKLVDRLNLVTREQLSGMLVIRAFNNQKSEEARFDTANKDMTNLNIFLNRLMSLIQPIMTFVMSGVSILIIWFGAKSIDLGTMQIGDMMAFLQYATHVLISFMIVAGIFIMIPRSSVSANRIFEVLETEPTIHDPENCKKLPGENQTITFNHVSFRYPHAESDVLNDISFEARPGETVAFIGSTGSGKSTLINLLPRFFDVTEGSIKFGDTDIREVSQKDLRDKIGYVPQKGVLFSGTIESNLKYADEHASDAAIEKALAVSQSKEFVSRLDEGIHTEISEGGTNVSGGQKQRLSIARALTKDAQVFIFDDTFSALDYATDAALREALGKMVAETKATVFIVAQRISTIMHADRIVVLDEGKVAGIGTHEELLKNCEVYQEIAHSQLSREELGE